MQVHNFSISSLSGGPMQDKDKNKARIVEHTGPLSEVEQNVASSSGQAKAERHYDYYDTLTEVGAHTIHTRSKIDSDICKKIRTLLTKQPKLKGNTLNQYVRKLVRMQLRHEDKQGNPKVSLEYLEIQIKNSWLVHWLHAGSIKCQMFCKIAKQISTWKRQGI